MRKTIEDTFTAGEAAVLTGVVIDTLRVWRRRGHFTLTGEQNGWTRFSFGDVLKIATFASLRTSWIENEAAEVVAANSPMHFAKILGGDQNSAPPYGILGRKADQQVHFEFVEGLDSVTQHIIDMNNKHPEVKVITIVNYMNILYEVMMNLKRLNDERETERG
jgi:DNA-binding transcriptional MerR regulator